MASSDLSHIPCEDYAFFKRALQQHRKGNDNITHKLNTIDVEDPQSCSTLLAHFRAGRDERIRNINRCVKVQEEATESLKAQVAEATPETRTSLSAALNTQATKVRYAYKYPSVRLTNTLASLCSSDCTASSWTRRQSRRNLQWQSSASVAACSRSAERFRRRRIRALARTYKAPPRTRPTIWIHTAVLIFPFSLLTEKANFSSNDTFYIHIWPTIVTRVDHISGLRLGDDDTVVNNDGPRAFLPFAVGHNSLRN